MAGFFSRDRIIAPPGFNRWKVPPASIGIHLCIGSVYAWSVFNEPLVRVIGVADSAAGLVESAGTGCVVTRAAPTPAPGASLS